MFNKPFSEASAFIKTLCLAQALGVTKFTNNTDIDDSILVTLFVQLRSSTNCPQRPEASLLNKSLRLAPDCVTKFINITDMILVTLSCAT
jgi:hypothetical protein